MNNEQVAIAFAKGDKECHSGTMRHNGEYLFSYSTPVAKRVGKTFLITDINYSSTTQRHIQHVMSACNDYIIVEDINGTKEYNTKAMLDTIKYLKGKAKRARCYTDAYLRWIDRCRKNLRKYRRLYERVNNSKESE